MLFQSETSAFKFLQRSVNGKHLTRFQSETSVFKFLQRSVNGKHLMLFQSETSVFKFLRRSVDGKHLRRFRVKPLFTNSSGVERTYRRALIFSMFLSITKKSHSQESVPDYEILRELSKKSPKAGIKMELRSMPFFRCTRLFIDRNLLSNLNQGLLSILALDLILVE